MKLKFILTITICCASLALAQSARAQDASPAPSVSGTNAGPGFGHPRGDRSAMFLQRLTKQLDLTADQQAKIKPILDDQVKQSQANRQDTSLTREQMMQKNKEIRDASNEQIKAILTPDQQAKFATMQQNARSRWQKGQAGASPAPSAPAPSPAAQ